jgi:hypothetical protein
MGTASQEDYTMFLRFNGIENPDSATDVISECTLPFTKLRPS